MRAESQSSADAVGRALAALPKAELHLHLEGSIRPATAVELAARHGLALTEAEVEARYRYADFAGFLEAYKWVISLLHQPADYALITERLAEELRLQNVLYAEVTLSVRGMLRRRQDAEANFAAIRDAGERARQQGLRLAWIFDGAWQFGPEEALEVARLAARCKNQGVVAFGMGGDELALPYADFRSVYDYAAAQGLRRVAHAGEVGGPEKVREAIELLGAERIGHGIASFRDPALLDLLAARAIPLEVCPTSNICTGALARQLGRLSAGLEDHVLPQFVARGLPVTLSTDDPAMFRTTLNQEYAAGLRMGMMPQQMARLAESGFIHAFLPGGEKAALLSAFREKTTALGLV